VMVYGPRDVDEAGVVEDLVRASHRWASGRPLTSSASRLP
jgi:hypothetical protein